jgi:hypothetical protein
MRGDDIDTGAKPKMIRIAEDDLRSDLLELARRHRLDGAVRADRHEYRCFDIAVREGESAATGAARRRRQRELHRENCSSASD